MISILCSNYNSDGWIDNYLSYLNSQTLEEFEVIFVDASSTDDSLQKIKDLAGQYAAPLNGRYGT